ncbi:MAG: RND family transporter [Alphaproteobacteria bacterium]
MIKAVENLVFRWRLGILALFALITVAAAVSAAGLRIHAGFEKQLPTQHPYVETFRDYKDTLFGANRIIVVLKARDGAIWTRPFMARLKAVTDDLFFLPGVDRRTVTSLWTPNTRYFEITEDGFLADDVIPGTVTPESMTREDLERIQNNVIQGGHVGRLVSTDFDSAMVVAELQDIDPRTREPLDYLALADALETRIRGVHEDDDVSIHIVGFAKLIGDVADGAGSVLLFFAVAFLITALLVYAYSRSLVLTALPLLCSLTSMIWQFGVLNALGYGLDPLAILVPFLVFAIGVSHGVQQINLIAAEIEAGATAEAAARSAFRGLLIPGTMALVTDLVGFGTLLLIHIPMIRELAVTAAIGVALKIVTNLVMLPLLASLFTLDQGYADRIGAVRAVNLRIMGALGRVARPAVAPWVLAGAVVLLAVGLTQTHHRPIGDQHAGAPELRVDARYNQDSRVVTAGYTGGLSLLTVVFETPSEACIKHAHMRLIEEFGWAMENVPGVTSVVSAATIAKRTNAGWNEGNPKWRTLPRNTYALVQATSAIPTSSGLLNPDCSVLPVHVFLEDTRAETLSRAVGAVKAWREAHGPRPVINGGTDRGEGTWALSMQDVSLLTFTAPPHLDDEVRLAVTVTGHPDREDFDPGDFGQGTLGSKSVAFEAPEPGRSVALDLRSALPDLPWADARGVILSGVPEGTRIRLASGNAGLMAAINEEIRRAELPMLLAVYAVIVLMVLSTYRDWRATLACCVPLTVATVLGYWFMGLMGIGLKVATLPVMVLAVGLGVDYAFYIYDRIQAHLMLGRTISHACRSALKETGMAVVFVALTMAAGVFTWVFSPLKFQADMGFLLFLMFMTNMIMAITVLPALAVTLDRLVPRDTRPSIIQRAIQSQHHGQPAE